MAFNTKEECCFKGRGHGYIGDVSTCRMPPMGTNFGNPAGTSFQEIGDYVGNILDLTLNQQVERRPTVFRAGQYEVDDCSPKIILGATVNITLSCSNMANMQRAFCGKASSFGPKPITTCKKYCPKNGSICELDVIGFPTPGVDETTVQIEDQDGNQLVNGVDFIADCFCITFCKNMAFTKDEYLKITWTGKYGYDCIDGLSKESVYNSFTFKGKNSNRPTDQYLVKLHKVSFDPVPDFSFISENNAQIPLVGTLFPINKYNLAYPTKNKNNWFEICRVSKGGCNE